MVLSDRGDCSDLSVFWEVWPGFSPKLGSREKICPKSKST